MTLYYLFIFLILLHYLVTFMLTGLNRTKYDVLAPATSGHPVWERFYRVQMNSLEQMAFFIPLSVLAVQFWPATWIAGLAAMYFVGRCLYAYLYIKNPTSRGPGMMIAFGASMITAVFVLVGIVKDFL